MPLFVVPEYLQVCAAFRLIYFHARFAKQHEIVRITDCAIQGWSTVIITDGYGPQYRLTATK
jgi:hypothetical protein